MDPQARLPNAVLRGLGLVKRRVRHTAIGAIDWWTTPRARISADGRVIRNRPVLIFEQRWGFQWLGSLSCLMCGRRLYAGYRRDTGLCQWCRWGPSGHGRVRASTI